MYIPERKDGKHGSAHKNTETKTAQHKTDALILETFLLCKRHQKPLSLHKHIFNVLSF